MAVRKSELFKENFYTIEDSVNSSIHNLIVRFIDLLSSPEACGEVLNVTKATEVKNASNYVYKMTSTPRGFCVIIDNQFFKDLLSRTGSRADANRLSNVFSQLGFKVMLYENQSIKQMSTLLKVLSKNRELSNHDALAVIILSHGDTNVIYGSDGEIIVVDYILELFNNQNCSLLINKPKMFFLSACRGGNS